MKIGDVRLQTTAQEINEIKNSHSVDIAAEGIDETFIDAILESEFDVTIYDAHILIAGILVGAFSTAGAR
jgi:hypothetical protein